jgi:hypothetical protein
VLHYMKIEANSSVQQGGEFCGILDSVSWDVWKARPADSSPAADTTFAACSLGNCFV